MTICDEIEALKSQLLRHTTLENPEPSDDIVASAETMVCNSCRQLLKEELCDISEILGKIGDKSDDIAIYRALDRAVQYAILAGMNSPNPAFIKLRQDMEEAARRARRKANIAAEGRREKMRPFVEDFLQVQRFTGLATMYKALIKRPEFRSVLPKSVNPRQIKGDMEAIRLAIDAEVEAEADAALDAGDMLRLIAGNGVRTIIVESSDRFARDLMVQEAGYAYLQRIGVKLISAASPEAFLSDSPSAVLVRQMFGAIAQFDRAMTIAKLKGARDRKRAAGVKVEGRKNYAEAVPETVALAQRFAREPLNGRRRSLRDIALDLVEQGHLTANEKPYAHTAIGRMLDQADGKRRRHTKTPQKKMTNSPATGNKMNLEE